MRKQLSDWTDQNFVEAVGALGMEYKDMARALGKHQATISHYATGRQKVPRDVALKILGMIDAEREKLSHVYGMGQASIGQLITHHNEHRKAGVHKTEGRFMRRQGQPDTRTFPTYRMSVERYAIYVEALAAWSQRVRELAATHTDEVRQRDYKLELADLKAMSASAPRHAPYDVCITRTEWDVVSRALRHFAATGDRADYRAAHALRTHWQRHRGCGYPIRRHTDPAAA
jgi:hypothetical protein